MIDQAFLKRVIIGSTLASVLIVGLWFGLLTAKGF